MRSMLVTGVVLGLASAVGWGQCEPEFVPVRGLAGVSGFVHASTSWDPDGPGPLGEQLVVAGSFVAAGEIPVQNIARWDGERWLPMGSGIDAGPERYDRTRIVSLVQHEGVLYASTNADWPTVGVHAWDGRAWQPMGGGAVPSGEVLVHRGQLVVGGGRIEAPGGWVWMDASALVDGQWQPLGDADRSSATLMVDGGGVLYAYGYFVLEAGDPPARLATWDGAAWSVLGGIPDWSSIRAMALHDGELYLGGEGHDSLGALAVLRGGQWVDVPLPLGDRVHSIASIDGRLVVARYAAGLERDAVIELVDGQWRPLRGLEAVHGFSVQEIDGRIVAGGLGLADRGRPGNGVMEYRDGGWRVLGTGGVPSSALHLGAAGDDLLVACAGLVADVGAVNLLTRFDGERFHPVAEDEPTLEGYGRVYTTLAEDDAIYFGGRFSSEDDRLSTCVSMIEDGLWKPMARGLNSDVHKILRYRGEVLAIGGFTSSYDEPVSVVARWTGEAWEQFGDGQLSGTATDAIVFDDRLVVCGPFGVVYWDEQAGSWSAMGDGRSVHLRQWFKMAAHDGELYVLGSSPGWFDNRVVRLNGERWEYFTDPIDGERGSLAWYDGRLYVGHWGVSSSGLSRWEGDHWLEFGDRFLSSPGDVRDMRVVDGELWIAGSFVGMDDVVSPNLIRLRCGCGVDLDGDGVLTLFDYFAFLNAFEARDPSADLDGDGEFTLLDFGAFQDAFDAGCP